MKIFYSLFFFLIAAIAVTGQGISFFEGTWEEAKIKAAEEQKLIFVDAYAKWCGPCKRMAKYVFTNPSVGEYFNENFINLKIDMEEGMGLEFRKEYPVGAFPTLFFIDETGEVVRKVVGGKSAKEFLDLAKSVIISFDRSGDYVTEWEKGNRDFDFVLKYIKALNRADKSSLKVSNDFLRLDKELTKEQQADFLFEALTHADSRIFTKFIEERHLLESIKGKEAVESKIESACWNTLHNAMEFEVSELVDEAKAKMMAHCKGESKAFALKADYEYAKSTGDLQLLNEAALRMAKELVQDKPDELQMLADELFSYAGRDKKTLDICEEIAEMSIKKEESIDAYVTLSSIALAKNNKKKAAKSIRKALKLAEGDQKRMDELNEILDFINGI